MDTNLFFIAINRPDTARKPKAVCATCPVVAECLEWGLSFASEYGIFGGLTPRERRLIRRQRRAA